MLSIILRGSEMKKAMSKFVFALILSTLVLGFLAGSPREAQATFLLWDDGVNHPEIDWKYTETEHFTIFWYPEEEFTARALVKIAEDVYDHDSKLWNYELKDKIFVVLLDTEDYSNGFAAHNFNWITMWASNLYYDSRGRTDWLADCFSHELGHIVSLKAGSTFRENMIGVLVGALVAIGLLKVFDAKFWGVVVMGGAVIILFFLPWLDMSPVKSIRYRPGWHKGVYAVFVVFFFILGYLGSQAPSEVGNYVSQVGTLFYFGFFLLMPWWSRLGEFKPVPDRVTFAAH